MAQRIIASAEQQSLRPLTQALVGALEVLLDEVAALRNFENGSWVLALEERVLASTVGLKGTGVDAQALQVAQSALRACFHTLRSHLH
jgi:hypothetical protein